MIIPFRHRVSIPIFCFSSHYFSSLVSTNRLNITQVLIILETLIPQREINIQDFYRVGVFIRISTINLMVLPPLV